MKGIRVFIYTVLAAALIASIVYGIDLWRWYSDDMESYDEEMRTYEQQERR